MFGQRHACSASIYEFTSQGDDGVPVLFDSMSLGLFPFQGRLIDAEILYDFIEAKESAYYSMEAFYKNIAGKYAAGRRVDENAIDFVSYQVFVKAIHDFKRSLVRIGVLSFWVRGLGFWFRAGGFSRIIV